MSPVERGTAAEREEALALTQRLEEVPGGTVQVKRYPGTCGQGGLFFDQFRAETGGKGRVQVYPVFPGIEAAFQCYLAAQVSFHHAPSGAVLELYHCRSGRIGWNMRGGTAVYLGAGDLSLHSADCCADSAMMLPLGYSTGLTLAVDLAVLGGDCPDILREAGFSAQELAERFCVGKPMAIPAGPELEGIFSPLYAAGEPLRQAYLKLKVQELLLFLSALRPGRGELTQYISQKTELIREIHQLLTQDLSRRYTIEELARRFPINTASLKAVFKAVYGLPIATYMKEYRVRQAMKLLRETDENIAAISAKVGYETQGKFGRAFREVVGQLPSEYRREYQKR